MFAVLTPLATSCQFVLIDDGSSDGTAVAIDRLATGREDVVAVRHPRRLGLGRSLRSGFERATGDAVLTLDADLTFHPTQASLLLQSLSAEVSCVSGSPIRGEMSGVFFLRRWMSRAVNRFYRLALGGDVTGVSSIFRVYRRAALEGLALESNDFDINAEVFFKLIRAGHKIVEVPVRLTARTWGASKINVGREIFNHLRLLWRIAGWKLFSGR